MANEPAFASIGTKTDNIDVRLSYRIIELFSEGLYTSPNKAVEELVTNSFDAGATTVHVLLSPNLHAQDATIVVIDDGEGMDQDGFKQHWLIGISNKRDPQRATRGRQQIGKFGIGKLSTYVLANRLTHISKNGAKYYSTSMDYRVIKRRLDRDVEPKAPIRIDLLELTADEAEQAVRPWADSAEFKTAEMPLFGDGSPESWTIGIMSDLKPKVHEIQPGRLRWILRTALPLRPDFSIWLKDEKLNPSKEGKDLLRKWIIGKDIVKLPRPGPKDIAESDDKSLPESNVHRFGLNVPGLGRVTGYVEAYKDLLTGKSDKLSRSHGFFVYVYGRLLNTDDGHFGIPPNELRHGTFGRFRLVVHMDGLDTGLRSNRETIGEGPLLETARNTLRAIFNAVRHTIDTHVQDEDPGTRLARKLADSPASLSRRPIVELTRAVAEKRSKARYLLVPSYTSDEERERFLARLDQRAQEADRFVTGVVVDFDGSSHDGIVKFDTMFGVLRLNGLHPFISTFHEEFTNKKVGQPLELFAMAEVLAEAHLHSIDVKEEKIEEFLSMRDQLLRRLANESGRQSASSVANELLNARNNPDLLEECVCDAFRILGFDARHIGKKNEPDGIAIANLPADKAGTPRRYKVSLEAKSKRDADGKVSAQSVDISAVIRHRDKYECDHAVVVGPAFPTSDGDNSALGISIEDDGNRPREGGRRTITLITVDDLAALVRLRPVKRFALSKIRKLFEECSLPDQSAAWIESIRKEDVEVPQYRRILDTIQSLQRKYERAPVKYAALRLELTHLKPPITYDTEDQVKKICEAIALMAPRAINADLEKVELDQSAENAMADIQAALQEHPPDEQ